ncbi:MAG: DEAD/DEAH box helicase [Myxococcales bacterium]|nr:DEAD/DEAH box helicase [Myxococcales bacterium]
MVCLDDDHAGRVLEVLWELELGARVLQPETHGLGAITGIDPPRHFGAYLHALKWSSVTATDAKLFQAPFRAGIELHDHQLTPLKKALALPRANLFIADDVGLGKTIEAGLVLQELLLRQRIELAVIVCPASVCLQWRDEMQKRFGLSFEVMSRSFIARRRQERGFAVNPWSTHNRFIVSHPIVRRPEYRDPLLQHIGERAKKSLLILDEAHVAAPASAQKYAVDSRTTRVLRDIAPRFENRLFLSATPHNGHSNSFSALLEILDPQRFTRGVPVTSAAALEPVMVRRLKEDLRAIGVGHFPLRKLVEVGLRHDGKIWRSRERVWDPSDKTHTVGHEATLAERFPAELVLSQKLAAYAALLRPDKGRGKLVLINLQKRLLSSIEAFARTLDVHARSVKEAPRATQLELGSSLAARPPAREEDEYGEDDDAVEAADAAEIERASRLLACPEGTAQALLEEMLALARRHRSAPDAKALALVDWIRRQALGPRGRWTDRRILVFTEYGDTKRYLRQVLAAAIESTDRADERILELHGGMSDEGRETVQRAFNSPPEDHPVRILLATDAAREGVNLQGHCADLFHYDVPWNPARMEQRNGRIDRTLQSAPEVRCHYFLYPDRTEDRVLGTLVAKIDTIQRELGSLSGVLMDRLGGVLEDGIDAGTTARLDAAEELDGKREIVRTELETERHDRDKLRKEVEECGVILNRSRAVMGFDPALLRDAIDVGLELAGAAPLRPASPGPLALDSAWLLPDLPESWQRTLDWLRPPRARDEAFWDWRKRAPEPVLFVPPPKMNSALVQLHLEHPFVQRILERFLAQGYSAHELSRVTVARNRHDSLVRVLAFGRLSLFGPGAARLHDELISVGARWTLGQKEELRPFAEDADKKAIERLEQILAESPALEAVPAAAQDRVREAAPRLFGELWPHIREEADAKGHAAAGKLVLRARAEADALRGILEAQRAAIERELARRVQLPLDFGAWDRTEREQFAEDKKHMEARRASIARELETEPGEIEASYKVLRHRLEPVGLVVLWPATRG